MSYGRGTPNYHFFQANDNGTRPAISMPDKPI